MASTPARAFRPVRPDGLVDEIAARCRPGLAHPFRVLIDGADATHPSVLAAALAQWLRTSGRPCAQVDLHDWLRPASLRLEHGHNNQDSYQDHWFDYAALRREVLEPLGPGGSRMWLPTCAIHAPIGRPGCSELPRRRRPSSSSPGRCCWVETFPLTSQCTYT